MSLKKLENAARKAFDAMVEEMAAELQRKEDEMFRSEIRRNELEAEGLAKDKQIAELTKKIAEMEGTIDDCNGRVKTMEKKMKQKTGYLKQQIKKFNDYRARIHQQMAALIESDPTGSISVSLDGMSTSNESGDDDDDDDDDDETTTGSGGDSTMNVGEPALDEATSSVQRQPSPFGSKISAESTGRETRAARRGNRTEPSIPITLKTSFRAVRGGRDKEPDGDKND